MNNFIGKPINISQPLLGKVEKSSHAEFYKIWKNNNSICVIDNYNKIPRSLAYIMSDSDAVPEKINRAKIMKLGTNDINFLNIGDVILITPEGKISVLYEANVHNNAILATDRCNLNCIMCPQPTDIYSGDMHHINMRLIDLIASHKIQNIAITGGEPTLVGDHFFELIATCKKKLPKTSVTILSNGKRFADFEFARKLALLNHNNLAVAIPLYSDNAKMHDDIVRVKNSFHTVIRGIYNLEIFKIPVEIRTVITKLNYRRLPDFARFVYRNMPFATHVALMGMETTGLARDNVSELWVDPFDYMNYLEEASSELYRVGMNFSIYNQQLCILPRKLWPFSRKSISEWKNIFLSVCEICVEKNKCGGFFETGGEYYSKYIKAIN